MSQNSLLNVNNNELEIIEFIIDEKQPDGKVYSGHYGINVAKVLEIIRLPNITSVPSKRGSPRFMPVSHRKKAAPTGPSPSNSTATQAGMKVMVVKNTR